MLGYIKTAILDGLDELSSSIVILAENGVVYLLYIKRNSMS